MSYPYRSFRRCRVSSADAVLASSLALERCNASIGPTSPSASILHRYIFKPGFAHHEVIRGQLVDCWFRGFDANSSPKNGASTWLRKSGHRPLVARSRELSEGCQGSLKPAPLQSRGINWRPGGPRLRSRLR